MYRKFAQQKVWETILRRRALVVSRVKPRADVLSFPWICARGPLQVIEELGINVSFLDLKELRISTSYEEELLSEVPLIKPPLDLKISGLR